MNSSAVYRTHYTSLFCDVVKACKAVAPYFYKMAHEKSQHAIFVDVPVTSKNSPLHQGLGIPSLPFAHIYHPDVGLVEELSFTRKHVADLDKKLDSYIHGSCHVTTDDPLHDE
jgi:hypothetical protein